MRKNNFIFRNLSRNKLIFIVAISISALAGCVGLFLLRRGSSAESTLRFVSIVHRHGDRAPSFSYPLDPYKGESFWPEGLGNLLQKGKVRMYEFGRFLRRRYDGFISSKYSAAETNVISSIRNRCLMSAELVLAGLYPPDGIQIWNQDLPWQPIPVHSIPTPCDDMIRVTKHCWLLSKETEKWTIFLNEEVNKDQAFLSYLSKSTGVECKTMEDINRIKDNLNVVRQQGLPLPKWVNDVYPNKIYSFTNLKSLHQHQSSTMIKLSSGVLINEILTNMKRKLDLTDSFDRRLHLYSAHDMVLVNLWRGMNFSQEITEPPPYAAALIFELHEIEDKYRVRVLYKTGGSDNDLSVLTVRGCEKDERNDGMCDVDTLSFALRSVIITDFDEACQNQNH
nr:PREDICTED: prostatic acid phosphatase-like [Bemisia tabaci]